MSKKTKTTSQSTQTTTPNNPTWVTEGLGAVGGGLQKLMGQDPKDFVAGPSVLQSQAFKDAAGLKSSPYFGQAGDIFGNVAKAGANTYDAQGYDAVNAGSQGYTASSLLEGLDKYMSPYTGQVVDAALADFDYGAGQTRANQALEEARSGAFGGSGAAITRAMTEGDLARGRAATSAQLRDQGFMRGAGLSAQDAGFRNDALQFGANAANQATLANAAAANQAAAFRAAAMNDAGQFNASALDAALARQLAAGNALTGLGTATGDDARASIALQGALGRDQQAIDQAKAAAPLSVLQAIASTYGSMPLNLLSGSTTTGSGSSTSKTWDPMGVLSSVFDLAGNAAQGAAAIKALSDRRLKTDIEKLGEREDGLGVYVYRYLWSPARFIGVMAQEVLQVKPEAVIHLPGGYMAVNYGAL